MLYTIVKIVREAAKIMITGDFAVHEKGAANFVTDKDVAVEAFIRKRIAEVLPEAGFVGEEEDFAADALAKPYTAVVDPIDGTTNFFRHMNLSVISVALLKDGKPYIGVVCNPYTDELFTAERGKGAFLNGERINVSDRAKKDAVFFTAWSTYKKEYAKQCFDLCEEVYHETCDIRRLGVCALELCYMAAGRAELYFEIRLFPWDYAAAALILTEAGGFVGTLGGAAPTFDRTQPLFAANSAENFDYLRKKVEKYVPCVPYDG